MYAQIACCTYTANEIVSAHTNTLGGSSVQLERGQYIFDAAITLICVVCTATKPLSYCVHQACMLLLPAYAQT
jgi:hypothetical protein